MHLSEKNFPIKLINHFFNCSTYKDAIQKAEFQPRTFSSGCNDAFSVFGFLAFLLALLDLILELNMNKRRRKRFSPNSLIETGNKIIQEWRNGELNSIDNMFNEQSWKENKSKDDNESFQKVNLYNYIIFSLCFIL